jgi:predicted kinase
LKSRLIAVEVNHLVINICLEVFEKSMLIVFGGLPGVGKTTLAKAVARNMEAVYLRVDTIEQALRSCKMLQAEVGSTGYAVAYRLAEENLRIGRTVVADSVNP